jgi:hypothetical protein
MSSALGDSLNHPFPADQDLCLQSNLRSPHPLEIGTISTAQDLQSLKVKVAKLLAYGRSKAEAFEQVLHKASIITSSHAPANLVEGFRGFWSSIDKHLMRLLKACHTTHKLVASHHSHMPTLQQQGPHSLQIAPKSGSSALALSTHIMGSSMDQNKRQQELRSIARPSMKLPSLSEETLRHTSMLPAAPSCNHDVSNGMSVLPVSC